jgi:hypothetical protein
MQSVPDVPKGIVNFLLSAKYDKFYEENIRRAVNIRDNVF